MSNNEVSILFTGRFGLLFTDENGIEYKIHTETDGDTVVMSREKVKAIVNDKMLDEEEREKIISKVLSLTAGIKWRIE